VADEIVPLTTVHDDLEAEMLCARLRQEGIQCAHRLTDWSSAVAQGLPSGLPTEILVRAEDLPKAQELLSQLKQDARGA
jgi:hypothetical protein